MTHKLVNWSWIRERLSRPSNFYRQDLVKINLLLMLILLDFWVPTIGV